ncbi:hypothetical protein OUZ56_010461 [Daphnia magna]|uniref:Uncharacterized protein n=1 Tax=Daphnia magna TaxID=35525 RepID=A0ABR0AIL9_9CRUS|nr:hypothetical protein OUZ56_010461 [Daphnia magna]
MGILLHWHIFVRPMVVGQFLSGRRLVVFGVHYTCSIVDTFSRPSIDPFIFVCAYFQSSIPLQGRRFFIIPRKKNTPVAKLRRKLIRKGFRQEQYRFQHIKDLEPAYRETASGTTARLIAQRRPTEDMQAVILPAPLFPGNFSCLELSTPELLLRIQAVQKVAEFILNLPSVSDSQPSQLRPPLEPISQPQAADPTPRRIRLDYFRSAVKSAQSRRKTGPRLADFFSPPSPKKPRFYKPNSLRPVEQLPDPPTPPGVPVSEPDEFIPNLADCEVRSEVGETEVEPTHV